MNAPLHAPALATTGTALSRAFLGIAASTRSKRRDFAAYERRDHAVSALRDYLASGEIIAAEKPDIILHHGLWWITTRGRR